MKQKFRTRLARGSFKRGVIAALVAVSWVVAGPDGARHRRRQAAARERFDHLTEALRCLVDKYAAKPEEADKRARLERALARLEQEWIGVEMDEVLRALEEQDFTGAASSADAVRESLRQILEALTLEARLEAVREREKSLADAARAIADLSAKERKVIEEGQSILDRAVPADVREIKRRLDALAAAQEGMLRAGALEEARNKAREILENQKRLGGPAARGQEKPGEAPQESKGSEGSSPQAQALPQANLGRETAQFARELTGSAGGEPGAPGARENQAEATPPADPALAQAGKDAAAAAAAMEQAAEALRAGDGAQAGKSQAHAEKNLEQMIATLDQAIAQARAASLSKPSGASASKSGSSSPSSSPGPQGKPGTSASQPGPDEAGKPPEAGADAARRQEALEKEARALAADAQKSKAGAASSRISTAADEMQKARQSMQEDSGSQIDAPGHQKQALKLLAEAREEIERLERGSLGAEDRQKLERLRRAQEEAAREAKRVAEALALDRDLSQEAARQIQKAADQMFLVEGLFREEYLDSGLWEAQRALKYLEDAAAAVRDKQRQYATEQAKVTLSSLQGDLDRLIAGQEAVKHRTEGIWEDLKKGGDLGVWEQEEIRTLVVDEGLLVEEARGLQKKLDNPQWKSVVYAWAAGEAAGKIEEIRACLMRSEITAALVDIESEVLGLLGQMREGLKTLLGRLDAERERPAPRPMASTGDMEMPLVRSVDEVRLLWNLQRDLNARVEKLRGQVREIPALTVDQRAALERLMKDQARIRQLGNDWRLNVYQEQR